MAFAMRSESAEHADLDVALDALFDFDLAAVRSADDATLLRSTVTAEAVQRRLSAIQVTLAAEIADRSRYELGSEGLSYKNGQPKPAPFLEETLRISNAEASRRITLGTAIRPNRALTGGSLPPRLPALADALPAGEISADAAMVIVHMADEVRRVAHPDQLDFAEQVLVRFARTATAQDVARLAVETRNRLDPDGVLPREQETRARRGLRLGRERNGIVPFAGGADPVTAALLQAAFDEGNAPGATPRFLSEEDRRDGTVTTVAEDGTETVKVTDVRTREQRQYDIFAGIVKAGLRNTGTEPGQLRSHAEVVVQVSAAELEAAVGTGRIQGIEEPISMQTVEQILCDATMRKAILGNDGEILALGKKQYSFTAAQRLAVVIRDGDTCLFCNAPAAWADMHHVVPYNDDGGHGRTDVVNAVLLCERHHYLIHHGAWKLRMIDGIPHVLAPPEIDPTQTWKRMGRPLVPIRPSPVVE